jgi:hypothetical protein
MAGLVLRGMLGGVASLRLLSQLLLVSLLRWRGAPVLPLGWGKRRREQQSGRQHACEFSRAQHN